MLMGHYGVALAASGTDRRLPLWVSFLAVQIVDVFWAIFLLTDIERVSLSPGLPSNSLVLEHMPYTHSLVGTMAFASLAAIVYRFATTTGWRPAGLVGLAVVSHWMLDLIVHRHDLTLHGTGDGYGFGLWGVPLAASGLELGLVVLSAWYFARRTNLPAPRVIALTAAMAGGTIWFYFGPRFTSVTTTAVAALATYAMMTTATWWVEGH
jgi:hypothetical protein